MGKRKVTSDQKIENLIDSLNRIVSCLEDIVENSSGKNKMPMTTICINHGIDYLKLRRYIDTRSIQNLFLDDAISSTEVALPYKIPQELLFDAVFQISPKSVIVYPMDLAETVDYILDSLTEYEREVIELRFGFNGEKPKISDEIASILKCNRAAVRDLEYKAICKMREPNNANLLRNGIIKSMVNEKYEEVRKLDFVKENFRQMEIYNSEIRKNQDIAYLTAISIERKAARIKLEDFGLSVRARNALKIYGCNNAYDVISKTDRDLSSIRGLGDRTIEEIVGRINDFLSTFGIDRDLYLSSIIKAVIEHS